MAVRATKNVQTAIIKEIVDTNGEFVSSESIKTMKVDREPDFIKLYTDDILKLKDVPKGMNAVLMALLKKMDYQNEITIVAYTKQEIADQLEVKEVTIRKSLEEFVKKGILIRKARSIYVFNPILFGRGSWEDIKKLRLTITYTRENKRTIETEFINY